MRRSSRILSAVFSLLLFAIALWAIQQSLGHQDPRDILHSIVELPVSSIGWACVLAVVNYLFVAGIDMLAARDAGRPVSYRRLLLPSFIGATFQYNAGIFGGTAIRYRLYSSLGFSPHQIGRIMLIVLFAFTVSFFMLTGFVLLWDPFILPETAALSWWPEMTGSLLLASGIVYFWLCTRGKSVQIFGWYFVFPHGRSGLLQVLLAIINWIVAAGTLYVLLPADGNISLAYGTAVFMLAHNAGIISNTPGGAGSIRSNNAPPAPRDILLRWNFCRSPRLPWNLLRLAPPHCDNSPRAT